MPMGQNKMGMEAPKTGKKSIAYGIQDPVTGSASGGHMDNGPRGNVQKFSAKVLGKGVKKSSVK